MTTRATLLAVVICVLVLTLAYPLRLYLQQQAKNTELTRANAQRQTRVDDLRGAVARFEDPLWVEDEARRRLHFVRPGEKSYLMPTTLPEAARADGGADGASGDQSWYGRLWSQANQEPAQDAPDPADSP